MYSAAVWFRSGMSVLMLTVPSFWVIATCPGAFRRRVMPTPGLGGEPPVVGVPEGGTGAACSICEDVRATGRKPPPAAGVNSSAAGVKPPTAGVKLSPVPPDDPIGGIPLPPPRPPPCPRWPPGERCCVFSGAASLSGASLRFGLHFHSPVRLTPLGATASRRSVAQPVIHAATRQARG